MVVIGPGPALASVAIMNRALREDHDLLAADRVARTAPGQWPARSPHGGKHRSLQRTRGPPAQRGRDLLRLAAAAILGYLAYRLILWLAPAPRPPPHRSPERPERHRQPVSRGWSTGRFLKRPVACSTSTATRLVQPAIGCRSGWLTVQQRRPERRSDDGQTILESLRENRHHGPDLLICEPPYGIEP
jgi:hypothetical protein